MTTDALTYLATRCAEAEREADRLKAEADTARDRSWEADERVIRLHAEMRQLTKEAINEAEARLDEGATA